MLRLLFVACLAGTSALSFREKRQFGFGGLGGGDDEGGSSFGGAGSSFGGVGSALSSKVSQLRNITATGCFTNEHGFKCCSPLLSTFLSTTFKLPLVESLLDALDLQKTVNTVLGLVQDHFGTSFEIVLSPGDFASKNTFRGDLMCKTKTPQGKVILIFATPVPYSTGEENRPLSSSEIKEKGWSDSLLKVSALSFTS